MKRGHSSQEDEGEEASHSAKRQRVEEVEEEEEDESEQEDEEDDDEEEEGQNGEEGTVTSRHLDTLKSLFKEAHESYVQGNPGTTTIEVEARLGQQNGHKFRPGIHSEEFRMLLEYFDTLKDKFSGYKNEEIDYIYPTPGTEQKGAYRVNLVNDRPMDGEIKSKLKSLLLKVDNMTYDVRVGLSQEINFPPPPSLKKDGWKLCRKKERWTYEHDEDLLKVDLTIVTTSRPKNSHVHGDAQASDEITGKKIYEAEFELLPNIFEKYLATKDEKTLDSAAEEFYKIIMDALQVLNKGGSDNLEAAPSPFPEIKWTIVESSQLPALKTAFARALRLQYCNDFPGSMPVTFGRRHFPTLQQAEYMVSEKTDGFRYMLLICVNGAFLVDRKYFFFQLANAEGLVKLFAKNDSITLLDGELIRHLGDGSVVFLLFDVIQVNGEHFADRNLTDRLKAIGHLVVEPYREAKQQFAFPFTLCGKRFFTMQGIKQLFKEFIKEDADKTRRFEDSTRNHKTDGVIFTPVGPYVLKACPTLFKWKFLDKQSIDFRAKRLPNNEFELFVQVKGGESKCFQTAFSEEDLAKLNEDFARYNKKTDAIIECGYDRLAGRWHYFGIRPDKKVPNFVRVALDTLMALAEGVTKEEVIAKCNPVAKPQPTSSTTKTHPATGEHVQSKRTIS